MFQKTNILRRKQVFLRKIRVLGPTRTLGEPFVKNPTDLVPLFARLSKCENFWENYVAILGGILLTHTSVIGQQNINIQIKYKVIVSQVSVVMSQGAHRKCWKRGFARGTWSSGKWQVVPSRKLTYPKFSQMFQKNQETCSFWLLGNAKNPTDLKPYWSRNGLRHRELATFSVDIRSPGFKPPPLAYFPMFPFCLLLFYIVFMLLPAKSLEFAIGLVSSCSPLIFLHEVSIMDPSRCFVYYLQSSSATVHKKKVKPPDFLDQHKSPYFFQILKDVTITGWWYT